MWKKIWRTRRTSNDALEQSGVWRYRELLPFDGHHHQVVSLREGNTPLLDAPRAARYGGLDRLTFKHQGFNPTGSFKDNGMTCGVTQAIRLDRQRVACVSTGNTSASMAAYASAAGLDPIVFIPHGNISYGKLAQALEYGARTFQVEANFDQILALVRVLADRLGIYLLNSINPFRIEGQKTIIFEMLDQRDWNPPDWIVLPGGNLGNTSAFGKALRELCQFGFIRKIPRLAVIQAEGAAPFYEFMKTKGEFHAVRDPQYLGHRHQDRRSGFVAQGAARGDGHEWHGGESERTGNRRRQSGDRTMRYRLRTRFGRDAGRNSQAYRGRNDSSGRGRGCGFNGECSERSGLHLSLSYGPVGRSRWQEDRRKTRQSSHSRAERRGRYRKNAGRMIREP